MLTKTDLKAIQGMLNNSNAVIISEVSKMIEKNVDDLVELITTGFNEEEERFSKFDTLIENHEQRINTLEKKTFNLN